MADQLRSLLEGMGQTADEVAAFLRGQGVKGHQCFANHCPLAVYLRQATGINCSVVATVWHNDEEDTRTSLTDATAAFRTDFDMGKYPDLIKETK